MANLIKPFLSILATCISLHAFCIPTRFSCLESLKDDNPDLGKGDYEDVGIDGIHEINQMENINDDSEANRDNTIFWYFQYLPQIQQNHDELLGNKIPNGMRMIKRRERVHKQDRRAINGRIRDGRIRLLKHHF